MSAQNSYRYTTPRNAPGGVYDLSPKAVNSRQGEGQLRFGIGVVHGSTPGTNVAAPTATATADKFEGIVLSTHTHEMDMEGVLTIKDGKTVNVMRYGRAWVRIEKDAEIAYGEDVYLITSGDEAGYFTNKDSEATKIAVSGTFIGASGVDGIAPVELFNGPAPADAPSLAGLSDVDLSTPATNGQTLKYNSSSETWKPAT